MTRTRDFQIHRQPMHVPSRLSVDVCLSPLCLERICSYKSVSLVVAIMKPYHRHYTLSRGSGSENLNKQIRTMSPANAATAFLPVYSFLTSFFCFVKK